MALKLGCPPQHCDAKRHLRPARWQPPLTPAHPRSLSCSPSSIRCLPGAYHETQTHCCREDPCGLPFPRAAGHSCFCTSHCTLHTFPSARLTVLSPLPPGKPHPLASQAQRCKRVAARVASPLVRPRRRRQCAPRRPSQRLQHSSTTPPAPTRSPDRTRGPCMTAVHEDQNVQKAEVQTAAAVRCPSPGDRQQRACRCHNNGREECALAARPRETPLTNGQSTPRTAHTPHA